MSAAASDRVRVAVVIDQLEPGGAEQLHVGLAAAAPGAGLDLSIVSLKPSSGPVAAALRETGVRVEDLPRRRLSNPNGALALSRVLARIRPDVIHSHLLYSDVLAGLVASRGMPLVSTLHVIAQPPGVRAAVRERLAAEVRRRRADRIVAVSEAAAGWYQARHAVRPGQLVVIRNGIRWSAPSRSRSDLRVQLGLPAEAFVVAMVGVMRRGKGHAEAIAAVEGLSNGRAPVLLLVGSGPEAGALRAQARAAASDVRVLGHRTDVPALLTAADALVLPSPGEALPTVAIEAMAAGIPVVAARGGGTPELVADGVTGILARTGDPRELAAGLSRLAADPDLARRLGEAGGARYREELTAETWAARLRALYEEVLAERAPRQAPVPSRSIAPARHVDAVLLDAGQRQTLVAIRSLGRAGIRTCAVERFAGSPGFASRWCAERAVVPDLDRGPDAYVDAILELVDGNRARVVLATHDGSIEALRARRDELERHTALALARESALATAIDKSRTLAVARELGIGVPRSIEAHDLSQARAAWREIGFPAVAKPLRSWAQKPGTGTGHRLTSVVVTTADEAEAAAATLLESGGGIVLQEWLSGAREAVSFLYAGGRIRGRFAQVAHRMTPALGGSSVLRESVPLPADIASAAESIVRAIDLEGYSEVEFRRSREGRPLLMEINPRLSASVEIAVRAGVDFPLLLYKWAAGERLEDALDYRIGLCMRWLGGDVEWLREVAGSQGRPDIPPLGEAVATFARDFARPASYDYVDLGDPRPAVTAARTAVAGAARRRLDRRRRAKLGAPR